MILKNKSKSMSDSHSSCARARGIGASRFCFSLKIKMEMTSRNGYAFVYANKHPKLQIMNLHNMINGLDACPKTTVAAINGQALGGGGEVALACHYRVAVDNAQIGFPEVLLGLLPGGQGTQRLPRVAPFDVALQMVMTGQNLNMMKANKAGIVDKVEPKGRSAGLYNWF